MRLSGGSLGPTPADVPLVTLDVDGEQLPNDWYLRLAREAKKALLQWRAAITVPAESQRQTMSKARYRCWQRAEPDRRLFPAEG